MLAGHLQTKKGYYYAVLNCKHPDGSRFPKWIATGIPDKKGNKKAAEEALIEFRTTYNEYGEKITSGNTPPPPAKAAQNPGKRKTPQASAAICSSRIICWPGSPTRRPRSIPSPSQGTVILLRITFI